MISDGTLTSYTTQTDPMAYATALAKSDEVGPVLANDADMLDPETLLAFFEMKMGDAKGKLNGLMQEQDAINARAKVIGNFEAIVSGLTEKGIKPGDEGWDKFVKAANEARDAVGAQTEEGKQIQA